MPHAREVLRPGGVLVGYLPTVLQVKALVDDLHADAQVCLRRSHGKHASILGTSRTAPYAPEHRMVAHTGFIVVARRVTEAAVVQVKSEKQVRQEAQ